MLLHMISPQSMTPAFATDTSIEAEVGWSKLPDSSRSELNRTSGLLCLRIFSACTGHLGREGPYDVQAFRDDDTPFSDLVQLLSLLCGAIVHAVAQFLPTLMGGLRTENASVHARQVMIMVRFGAQVPHRHIWDLCQTIPDP